MAVGTRVPTTRVLAKIRDVLVYNWYLGFTAFGGPPVHFKIFHDKFVTKLGWVDEGIYQELFAICQAFSGPGSTKMHYCLNLIHDGFLPAVLAFLIWSLPGAIGMYGLSIGVSHIGESLPRAAYALLSGLNAAVVGIIALAAVQLAQKAITDTVTRILVFLGATVGLLYNALWYLPLIMFLAGCVTIIFDFRILHGPVRNVMHMVRQLHRVWNRGKNNEDEVRLSRLTTSGTQVKDRESEATAGIADQTDIMPVHPPVLAHTRSSAGQIPSLPITETEASDERSSPRIIPEQRKLDMSWQHGAIVISSFFVAFTIIMVLRGTLPHPSLVYSLFANMFLAGTIIFGGGPVVVPLLREYVVAEGWVSPRDFLIGLAIIQAFPGPNFNFAVYLGSLTAIGGGYASALGAILGYIGIFAPGLITVHGEMGLWSALRKQAWVKSGLRGINAAAVGLIYTAVYRLWQIGYVDLGFEAGTSLGNDPWWVVVTATSYVGGYWFGLNPPLAILLGAIMGLIRYAVISSK